MPLLSLRGYAKHRGVSLAAVQKAIKSGRIATTAGGQVEAALAGASVVVSNDAALATA